MSFLSFNKEHLETIHSMAINFKEDKNKQFFLLKIIITIFIILKQIIFIFYYYPGFRFDVDTLVMTRIVNNLSMGNNTSFSYGQGFGFQYFLLGFSKLVQIDPFYLDLIVIPLIGGLTSLFVYSITKKILKNDLISTLSVLFINLQPEYLLYTSRGKYDFIGFWVMLLVIYFLFEVFKTYDIKESTNKSFFLLMIIFSSFTLAIMNITYTIMILTILVLGIIFKERSNIIRYISFRFIIISVFSIIILLILISYIYPYPLNYIYEIIADIGLIFHIFLNISSLESYFTDILNSLSFINQNYSSPFIFLTLSIFNISLVLFSFIYLIKKLLWVIFRHKLSLDIFDYLYIAFCFGMFAGLLFTLIGFFGTYPIYYRVFIPFSIISSVVAIKFFFEKTNKYKIAIFVVICILSLVVLFPKAALDPRVSEGVFYITKGEVDGSIWVSNNIKSGIVFTDWRVQWVLESLIKNPNIYIYPDLDMELQNFSQHGYIFISQVFLTIGYRSASQLINQITPSQLLMLKSFPIVYQDNGVTIYYV